MLLISFEKKIILSSVWMVLFNNLVYSAVYFAEVNGGRNNTSTWSDTPAWSGGTRSLVVLEDLTVNGASISIGNDRHMYYEGNLLVNLDFTSSNTSGCGLTVNGNNIVNDPKGDNIYLSKNSTKEEINLSILQKGIYIINLATSEKIFSYCIKKK